MVAFYEEGFFTEEVSKEFDRGCYGVGFLFDGVPSLGDGLNRLAIETDELAFL